MEEEGEEMSVVVNDTRATFEWIELVRTLSIGLGYASLNM